MLQDCYKVYLPRLSNAIKVRVLDLTSSEFEIEYTQLLPGDQELRLRFHVKCDKEKGDVVMVGRVIWDDDDASLFSTEFTTVHRDPLRLEVWTVTAHGERVAGRLEGVLWQAAINILIDYVQ